MGCECRDCPYGKEDFERRMAWYNQTIEKHGVPNDIYHNLEPEDAPDEFEQFVWCDKVGGKVCCFGYCTDIFPLTRPDKNEPKEEFPCKNKQKSRQRRKAEQIHKRHLKYLAEALSGYPAPAYCVDERYYKRLYRSQSSKYIKRRSNKKVRRYKGDLSSGRMFHKVFDFWWELY